MTIALALGLVLALAAWWWERSQRLAAESRHGDEVARQSARIAAQLEEQADRTAALFDRMVEGIAVTDAGGRIRLANRAAGELFGFQPPALGKTLLEAMRRHEVAAVADRLERDAEVLGYEMCLEGAGAVRYLQINALALRDGLGERTGAIYVFHDVTRLRQLEAMRQEFVANVSHELRTPALADQERGRDLDRQRGQGGRRHPGPLPRDRRPQTRTG